VQHERDFAVRDSKSSTMREKKGPPESVERVKVRINRIVSTSRGVMRRVFQSEQSHLRQTHDEAPLGIAPRCKLAPRRPNTDPGGTWGRYSIARHLHFRTLTACGGGASITLYERHHLFLTLISNRVIHLHRSVLGLLPVDNSATSARTFTLSREPTGLGRAGS